MWCNKVERAQHTSQVLTCKSSICPVQWHPRQNLHFVLIFHRAAAAVAVGGQPLNIYFQKFICNWQLLSDVTTVLAELKFHLL